MNDLGRFVDEVAARELTIEVGAPLAPHGQALMELLGVTVVITPGAPTGPEPGLFVDTHSRRFRKEKT